jgi:hypothetical protein
MHIRAERYRIVERADADETDLGPAAIFAPELSVNNPDSAATQGFLSGLQ